MDKEGPQNKKLWTFKKKLNLIFKMLTSFSL